MSGNRWVFGYGSLMWRPGFEHLRALPATLHGFHRRLCIYSHQYRGTPAKPGLVFGLARGGSCRGVAFEVAPTRWPETLAYLRDREQLNDVYVELVKHISIVGLAEPAAALAFVANRGNPQYAGKLSDHEIFALVEQGEGQFGHCRDYVKNTLDHLRALHIRDRHLEHVARLLGLA